MNEDKGQINSHRPQMNEDEERISSNEFRRTKDELIPVSSGLCNGCVQVAFPRGRGFQESRKINRISCHILFNFD